MEQQKAPEAGRGLGDHVVVAQEGRDTKIKGLILAAGRGSRLGGASDSVPKCLLEVGRRCLIEHQLDALADAGVGPTVMVIGYGADEVRETVGMRAEYIVNTRWNCTNSLYSFWMARDWIDGPVLILNSDVFFSPEILERLLKKEGDAIAIDSGSGSAREQMKVKVHEGQLQDMRKDLPREEAGGENVGILKLTAATAQTLFEKADQLVSAGHEKSWLGSAVRELAATRPLYTVDIAGLPWVEIDFPTDLRRARKEIWPAIRGSSWKRRAYWRVIGSLAAFLLMVGTAGVVHMALPAQPPTTWELMFVEGLEHTKILMSQHQQSWWVLEGDRTATVKVEGPGPLRIDSRLLEPDAKRAQYVIEVNLDGECLDWFKFNTRPSKTATHSDWRLGRRKRITIDLPEGAHEIQVGLVAPTTSRCLIRIRHLEALPDD